MLRPFRTIAPIAFALLAIPGALSRAQAQDAKTPYPNMAPVTQYFMEPRRNPSQRMPRLWFLETMAMRMR
jgi:hypothetical protein